MANIDATKPLPSSTPVNVLMDNNVQPIDKDFYKSLFEKDRSELPTYENYEYDEDTDTPIQEFTPINNNQEETPANNEESENP